VTFNARDIRDRFPVLSTTANGHPLCYLDNAATTPVNERVLAAMQSFETSKRGNVSRSGHYLAASIIGAAAVTCFDLICNFRKYLGNL